MAIETGDWLSDLVETNPVGSTDKVKTIDDHLQLIKKVLQNSFPDHSFPQGTIDLAGAADVYTVTFVQNAPAAYTKYMRVSGLVAAGTTNTGASTININALGAKAIKQLGGGDVVAGDLVAGRYVDLIYDGTNFVLAGPYRVLDAPAGTRMTFQQAAAPTGWTKDTTAALDGSAFRVVTTTAFTAGLVGGATAFTGVFGSGKSSGSYTLLQADVPAHAHTIAHTHSMAHTHAQDLGTHLRTGSGADAYSVAGGSNGAGGTTGASSAANTGGSSAANSGSYGGGGGHAHTLSLDLKFMDWIVASRDA